MLKFTLEASDGLARAGILDLPHGRVKTPVFMPVGTRASIRGMTPHTLKESGVPMILSNAWHLMLRPGTDLILAHGGLHRFTGWDRPILTDSGGYQLFSLAKMLDIDERGICFQSPYDGKQVALTVEEAIRVQQSIGADVIMAFDECAAYLADKQVVAESMRRSMRWAARSRQIHNDETRSTLFGIVQGGTYTDLRAESATRLIDIGFSGYALGGLAVGESPQERNDMLDFTTPLLPVDQPRYVMGVGSPQDIVDAVFRGADMFDCVIPTRNARSGYLYTRNGLLRIRNAVYRRDLRPIDESCGCYTCCNFSRAYLRHLDQCKEVSSVILNTIHNLHYYQDLMRELRATIRAGRLNHYRSELFAKYKER